MRIRTFNITQQVVHPVTRETLLTEDKIKDALRHRLIKRYDYIKHDKDTYHESSSKTVDVNGKSVIMDSSIFDPNFVDKQGRTNVQRMEQGLAPIGTDGKSVNIHHIDQTNNESVMEITATEHQQNYSKLHTNIGQSPLSNQ